MSGAMRRLAELRPDELEEAERLARPLLGVARVELPSRRTRAPAPRGDSGPTRVGQLLPQELDRPLELPTRDRRRERIKGRRNLKQRAKKKRKSRALQRLERAAAAPALMPARPLSAERWGLALENALEDLRLARDLVTQRGDGVWYRALADLLRRAQIQLQPLVRELEPTSS